MCGVPVQRAVSLLFADADWLRASEYLVRLLETLVSVASLLVLRNNIQKSFRT